jgi:hypothetical protein
VVPAKPYLILLAALSVAACGGKPSATSQATGHAPAQGSAQAQGEDASTQEQAYLSPPRVEAVRSGPVGVTLIGSAPAGGRVRLATPAGAALFADANANGTWAIALPPAAQARIFGLSVSLRDRKAQAEGYVLVTSTGQAALLRAGAGTLRIDRDLRPGLRAIDFDRGGGMEVSVQAAPAATVIVRLDGHQAAEGRADAQGRYGISLGATTPIKPGTHQVQVFGDGFSDQATVQLSPAAPLADGPMRSQLTPAGLRVDWMTPGGGVQSTLLIH